MKAQFLYECMRVRIDDEFLGKRQFLQQSRHGGQAV